MNKRGKSVDVSSINVTDLEEWIKSSPDRASAIKCQALIALSKGVSVSFKCHS
jgi:hypothetical protein